MKVAFPDYVQKVLVCPFCRSGFNYEDLRCESCGETYPVNNGQPDFRLRRPKPVDVQFMMGTNPFPSDDFDFSPLPVNPKAEVDYTGVKGAARVSKEQLSYIPKAKSNDSVILDLGCGTALHRELCEHAGYKYVGLDYDEPDAPMLGDAHALPFKDNSFDFILSIAVLEHIYNPYVMMREAFRVLKPGGKIVGTVAFLEPFHANSCYHHSHLGTYYTLSSSGFDVQRVAPNPQWTVLMAQAGMLFKKMPRKLAQTVVYPVYLFHRLWWKTASQFSKKANEKTRILYTSGSFTFIAAKPV